MRKISPFLIIIFISIETINGELVTISNTKPRLDTSGNIVNAHDGNIVQWTANGDFFWYAAGYGNCTEPTGLNGCADASVNNSCGFEYNHSVNLYTSPDLSSGSWKFESNVLPLNNRPSGIVFAPSVVFNPNTNQYILYANYLPTNDFSTSLYFGAISSSKYGPFTVKNTNINLTNPQPGDGKLFVDTDGKGYYVYTSISLGHKIAVERLNDDYLSSSGAKSDVFESSNCLEAPTMFKHEESGLYFVLTSFCCCYCGQGGDVIVWTSSNALGPYTLSSYINDADSNGKGKIIISAQQTNVFAVNTTNNGMQYIWIGDRWQTSPNHIKASDFTYWGPLQFTGSGGNTKIETMQWRDNFTIDIQT